MFICNFFVFLSTRRNTRSLCDWSSDVCSSDLARQNNAGSDAVKLYRVAGGSTQLHGIASDVILPSLSDLPEFGEGALKNALRSEERRVGKEGRSQVGQCGCKKELV